MKKERCIKLKAIFFLTGLVFGFFLLPNVVEAECCIACGYVDGTDGWGYDENSCYWGYGYTEVTCGDVACGGTEPTDMGCILVGCGQEKVGIVGSISESTDTSPPMYGEVCFTDYCAVGTFKYYINCPRI